MNLLNISNLKRLNLDLMIKFYDKVLFHFFLLFLVYTYII